MAEKRKNDRLEKMRNRQNKEQRFSYKRAYVIPDNVPRYKMKDGENRIDIIPYRITNPLNPAVTIHGLEVGELDYFQQLDVHQSVGVRNNQHLCAKRMFSRPCYICEAQIELYNQNEREEAKGLYPKQRAVYNVIDLDEPEKGIQVWEVSYYWVEEKLRTLAAAKSKRGATIVFGDWEIGKTISFIATEDKPWGLKPDNFTFEEREEQYDESICDKAYPLDQYYVMPDYEEVQADYLQITDDLDDEDDAPAPPPRRERRTDKAINDVERIPDGEKDFDQHVADGEKFLKNNPTLEPDRSRRRRRAEEPENKCPKGHKFGEDFDNTDDCTDCSDSDYDACGDAFDKLDIPF
jgi:hypothetical protein